MASRWATTSSDWFAAARTRGTPALICYITAGHPDIAESTALLRGLGEAGADVVEVGVPFSDPLADGPVIQSSSQRALAQGMTFERTLTLIGAAAPTIPVVLFSYLNPVIAAGADALARAHAVGVDGILITDLPVGTDPEREAWLGSGPLAFVRLVAPTTPDARMAEIARHGSGFVYLISRLGVTGARAALPPDLPETVGRLRRATTLPICVGFGISTAAQARTVGRIADGIVVGSALVTAVESGGAAGGLALVRELRAALDTID